MIDKNVLIEDLVREIPASVRYLMKKNIRCLVCGEPTWGTLEEVAKQKGFTDEEITQFVKDLNALAGDV